MGCTALCPVLIPCALSAIIDSTGNSSNAALEGAWGVISSLVSGQQMDEARMLVSATTRMLLQLVLCIAEQNYPGSLASHRSAMAQCLVQVARADQMGMKTEVAALPAQSQQTIQQLLREHMSAASGGSQGVATAGVSQGTLAKSKIEL